MKSSSRKGLIMIAVAGACGLAACGGDNTSDPPAAVGGVSQGVQTQPDVASASNLAAGTTSASDAALPRVVANVEGLADNTSLTLFVDYDEAVVTKTNGAVAWPATLSPRNPKAVTIAVQPKGQHCDIDQGKNRLREAVSLPVSVRCKERSSIVFAAYANPRQLVVSSIDHDTGQIRAAASDRVDLPVYPLRSVLHSASNTVYVTGDDDEAYFDPAKKYKHVTNLPVYGVDSYSGRLQKHPEELQTGSLERIDDIALNRSGERLYAVGAQNRFGLATLDEQSGRVTHMIRTESDLIPSAEDQSTCSDVEDSLGLFRSSPKRRGFVTTPDERFAYVLECDTKSKGYRLRGFSVGTAMARFDSLLRLGSGAGDLDVVDVALNPQGTLMYLLPRSVAAIYVFQIDRETGLLSPAAMPTVALERAARTVTVSPDGTHVFVGHAWHRQQENVSAFVANPKTGEMHAVAKGRFAIPGTVQKIVIDPSQTYLYLIGSDEDSILAYSLPADLSNAELIQNVFLMQDNSPVSGVPVNLMLPS